MLSSWIIFLLLGRVIIYAWQQFPLPTTHRTLEKLHQCDFCGGVWIYSILAFCAGLSLLEVLGFKYVPVVSEIATGIATSFVMSVFVAGWKEKFNILVIE